MRGRVLLTPLLVGNEKRVKITSKWISLGSQEVRGHLFHSLLQEESAVPVLLLTDFFKSCLQRTHGYGGKNYYLLLCISFIHYWRLFSDLLRLIILSTPKWVPYLSWVLVPKLTKQPSDHGWAEQTDSILCLAG